jgi:hypothetical protein
VKTITLTRGQIALVDDADFEALTVFKWQAHRGPHDSTWYAVRAAVVAGRETKLRMHRVIAGAADGIQVDHRNGNGVDNQRHNLRLATGSQNQQHRVRATRPQMASKFKGLSWEQGRWRARILAEGRRIHLGAFASEIEAAKAYDAAALKYFGEFAAPNFTSTQPPKTEAQP